MSGSEFQTVSSDDCWFRNLTNSDFITRAGTLHRQALKTNAFSQSVTQQLSHEMSGRLLSLALDLVPNGEAAAQRARDKLSAAGRPVPGKIKLVGWAWATVGSLRQAPRGSDVIPDRTDDDVAHANFVAYGSKSEIELEQIREWLLVTLAALQVGQEHELTSRRVAPPPRSGLSAAT
jgi:hypothetical protein